MSANKRVIPVSEQSPSEVRKKRFLYANKLQYVTPYPTSHKKVLLIDASFDAEKRNSGAWKVQELASNQS